MSPLASLYLTLPYVHNETSRMLIILVGQCISRKDWVFFTITRDACWCHWLYNKWMQSLWCHPSVSQTEFLKRNCWSSWFGNRLNELKRSIISKIKHSIINPSFFSTFLSQNRIIRGIKLSVTAHTPLFISKTTDQVPNQDIFCNGLAPVCVFLIVWTWLVFYICFKLIFCAIWVC